MNKSTMDLIAAIRPAIAHHPDSVVPQADREALLDSIVSTGVIDQPRRTPLYRRPVVIGSVAAAAVAAVATITAIVPTGGGGSGGSGGSGGVAPTGQVKDAAYMVDQMAKAMTNADAVVHFRETVTAGGPSYVEDHWYRLNSGLGRMTTAQADGTRCSDATITGLGPLAGDPNGPGMTIAAGSVVTGVDDANHTWWTFQGLPDYLHTPACEIADPDDLGGYSQLLQVPLNVENIKQELTAGRLHVLQTGAVVNGQRTIELDDPAAAVSSAPSQIWINDTTYQPVRSIMTGSGGRRLQTDYEFLPPTAANIADLKMPVPSGYQRVAPPTDYYMCPKLPCTYH